MRQRYRAASWHMLEAMRVGFRFEIKTSTFTVRDSKALDRSAWNSNQKTISLQSNTIVDLERPRTATQPLFLWIRMDRGVFPDALKTTKGASR
jgi:hypothetical protein